MYQTRPTIIRLTDDEFQDAVSQIIDKSREFDLLLIGLLAAAFMLGAFVFWMGTRVNPKLPILLDEDEAE